MIYLVRIQDENDKSVEMISNKFCAALICNCCIFITKTACLSEEQQIYFGAVISRRKALTLTTEAKDFFTFQLLSPSIFQVFQLSIVADEF